MTSPAGATTPPGEQPSWAVGGAVDGWPGGDAAADFSDCPTAAEFPHKYPPVLDENGDPVIGEDGRPVEDTSAEPIGHHVPAFCIVLTAYDGELKLGDTVASVDPIELTLAASATGVSVVGGGGADGGVEPVKMSGGILGIPELDPVWDASLGLLSVSATPTMGAAKPGRSDDPPEAQGAATQFAGWAAYGGTALYNRFSPVELSLPLSITLNNTLFGGRCTIDEFAINLTTGTTQPPPGVAPMTGIQEGTVTETRYETAFTGSNVRTQLYSRVGAELVDNTFAVPAPHSCDLVFGDLLQQDAGLFDGLIAAQAGLPSPAGNNHARFKVDVRSAHYGSGGYLDLITTEPLVCGPGCQFFGFDPAPGLAFGNVPVGQSATRVATLTNRGIQPVQEIFPMGFVGGSLEYGSSLPDGSPFHIESNGCAAPTVLMPGESCEVAIRYAPTEIGARSSRAELWMNGALGGSSFSLSGTGVAATDPPAEVAPTTTAAPTTTTTAPPAQRCTTLLGIRLCL